MSCMTELPVSMSDPLPSLFCVPGRSSTECSIFNINTKEFVTFNSKDCVNVLCDYSKGGWLLFGQGDPQYPSGRGYFLFNHITQDKLDLPSIRVLECDVFFDFSLVSGTPALVVRVTCEVPFGFIIRVARPGDSAWEEHEFRGCPRNFQLWGVALIGTQVMSFDAVGRIVIFEMSDGSWQYKSERNRHRGRFLITESEGEILKVNPPTIDCSSFSFFRFDRRGTNWLQLDDRDLEDRSWFFGYVGCFSKKGKGKKAYVLHMREIEECWTERIVGGIKQHSMKLQINPPSQQSTNVEILDLAENNSHFLLPNGFLAVPGSVHWVDIV